MSTYLRIGVHWQLSVMNSISVAYRDLDSRRPQNAALPSYLPAILPFKFACLAD
jgi:hypothetical protein